MERAPEWVGLHHFPLTDETDMLVLTRKTGEEIVIDGDIRVTISGIQGGRVRIGVTAPPGVRVDRAEIARRLNEFAPEAADRPRELAATSRSLATRSD